MSAQRFDEIGQLLTGNRQSSMFGVPCFKLGRRPFISLYEGKLVCKLPEPHRSEALQLSGASAFNPRGNARPMGNWIQIPERHQDRWDHYATLAYEALREENGG